MNAKRFICRSGKDTEVFIEVTLNGVCADEPLTPKMAARAAFVAFGHRNGVTVTSNDEHRYRLYSASARKLQWGD